MTINEIINELKIMLNAKPTDMEQVCKRFYSMLDENISEKMIEIMIKYSSYCMNVDNIEEILDTIQEDFRERVFNNLYSINPTIQTIHVDNLRDHIVVKISTPRRVEITPGNWVAMKDNEIVSIIAKEFKDFFMQLFESDVPPLVLFKCKEEDMDIQGRMDHIFYTLGTYHYTRTATNQSVKLSNVENHTSNIENTIYNIIIHDMDTELKDETLFILNQSRTEQPIQEEDENYKKLSENFKKQLLKKGSELYVEMMQNMG